MSGMNILICGLYFSGSTAVKDLLSEYSSITVIPGEFDDFRRTGLIGDHVSGLICDDYPSRVKILTKNCMDSSFLYSSHGVKAIIKNKIRYRFLKSGLGRFTPVWVQARRKRMLLADNLESCLSGASDTNKSCKLANSWIREVKKIYSRSSQFYIFDKPIFLGQHSDIWPEVFDPCKLIVVIRDPRDQIAVIISHKSLFKDYLTPTEGVIGKYGRGREAAIKYHLDMSLSRLKSAMKLQEDLGDKKVLIIRFEDIVKNTDRVQSLIEGFLGLKLSDEDHRNELFKPEESLKNIGIYNKFLNPLHLPLFNDYLKFLNKNFPEFK